MTNPHACENTPFHDERWEGKDCVGFDESLRSIIFPTRSLECEEERGSITKI